MATEIARYAVLLSGEVRLCENLALSDALVVYDRHWGLLGALRLVDERTRIDVDYESARRAVDNGDELVIIERTPRGIINRLLRRFTRQRLIVTRRLADITANVDRNMCVRILQLPA